MRWNITEDLLDTETNVIDKQCIKKKDYDIDIDKAEKIVIVNATINVCNKTLRLRKWIRNRFSWYYWRKSNVNCKKIQIFLLM